MPIIMLMGAIGSGKSRAAKFLGDEGFLEYTFAGPLKEIAKILGFSDAEIYGTQEEKLVPSPFWGVSGRKFLQTFGSEVCRDFLPKALPEMKFTPDTGLLAGKPQTLWCRLMAKKVAEAPLGPDGKPQSIVFSDGRFPDEVEFSRSVGAIIVKLERPKRSLIGKESAEVKAHQSELGSSEIVPDYTIINDGNLLQLKEAIKSVYTSVRTSSYDQPITIKASELPYDRAWLLGQWKEIIRQHGYTLFTCPFCHDACGWFYGKPDDAPLGPVNNTLYYSCGCSCVLDRTPPRETDEAHLLQYLDGEASKILALIGM